MTAAHSVDDITRQLYGLANIHADALVYVLLITHAMLIRGMDS